MKILPYKYKAEKVCSRCVMDDTVPGIVFDEDGVCTFCKIHDELESMYPLNEESTKRLQNLVDRIKREGKDKKYDCIVGVSGGRDSSFTLLTTVKLGLRPLAVTFDNGWGTETAESNINKATEKLKIDLHKVSVDWDEMKDLQIAFLKASVSDVDAPSDIAIYTILYEVAVEKGIKFIFNGHSFRTEGTSPLSWSYFDSKYVKSVHKKFGKIKRLKRFPLMSMFRLIYFSLVKRIKEVRLLEYIDYNKELADKVLKKELNWEYYGGHHHENTFTKFLQSYYFPVKFNIDKRKTEYSALIRSGQISRAKALEMVMNHAYPYEKENIKNVIYKLGIGDKEFEEILNLSIKSHNDYHTYLPYIRLFKIPLKIVSKLKLIPYILYLKYAR